MPLYFTVRDESIPDTKFLERKVDAYVSGIELDTAADLATAVGEVLGRISNGVNGTKKRELARSLGEASITPHAPRDATIKEFVSTQTFYSKNKKWLHDPDYREVLEIVIALHRKWEGGRAARDMAKRQHEWREKMHTTAVDLAQTGADLLASARLMMEQPLYEQTITDDDGNEITLTPARWTQDTANKRVEAVGKIVETADKIARLALDMATDRTEQTVVTADVTDTVQKVQDTRESLRQTLNTMRDSMIQPTAVNEDGSAVDEEE